MNSLGADFARRTGVQTLIISGERDYQRVKDMVKGLTRVKVFPFRTDMGVVYSAVDVAVVRAGSSTLTEISLFGIPALMIPYPFAVGDQPAL
ncbi:MAG: glycosyltransferase [Aquificota bacterium]|nr:glycosyltransferase [Aquificota bacterium]